MSNISKLFLILCVLCTTQLSAQLSGTAFKDYNHDGTKQATATYAEPFLPGIIVNAYNSSDLLIASYTTNINGAYAIPTSGVYNGTVGSNTGSVPNGLPVRLEFVIPASACLANNIADFASGSASTYGSAVQFVSGGATNINFAVASGEDYTKNPSPYTLDTMFVTRIITGNPAGGGTAGSRFSLYKFGYTNNGNTASATAGVEPPGAIPLARNSQIGSVYGSAYSPAASRLFLSAFMKRHAGFGPANGTFNNAPGAIYKVNPKLSVASPAVSYFASLDALGFPTHNSTGTPIYGSASYTALENSAAPATDGRNVRVTYTANGLGVIGTNTQRGLPSANTGTSADPAALGQIGKVSLGDLDVSTDGKFLYTINLFDRKLYKLELNNAADPTSVSSTIGISLPNPPLRSTSGITNAAATYTGANDNTAFYTGARGVQRPFAIAINRGKVYVGAVTTGEGSLATTTLDNNTGNPEYTDLWAYVWELDPATNTFATTPVLQFPLNFDRGTNSDGSNESWRPWRDTIPLPVLNNFFQYPQPILSDIVFDTSNVMILGFRDRWGDQSAYDMPSVINGGTIRGQAFGDLLRAYYNPTTCAFQLETNAKEGASSGKAATAGAGNGDGPANGEFYHRDHIYDANDGTPTYTFHLNTTMGGLSLMKGSNNVATTAMDPLRAWSGGISWFNNTTGDNIRDYEMYSGTGTGDFPTPAVGDFGKANGFGDLELLTFLPPIEIGNRLWNDLDTDGIQDANEPSLPNVTLNIYSNGVDGIAGNADDVLLGTTTSNANGVYLFTSATGTDGNGVDYGVNLQNSTSYNIRISNADWPTAGGAKGIGDLDGFNLTTPNIQGNGFTEGSDNDAQLSVNSIPMISLTTGGSGQTNHNLDFGFYKVASLGDRVWRDDDKDGIQDANEPGVAGVAIVLYQNGADGIPDTYDDVQIGSTVTDAYGNYFFDNLAPSTSNETMYNVAFTQPSNYTFSPQTNTQDVAGAVTNTSGGATAANGSDVNPATGVTGSFFLNAGQSQTGVDAGVIVNEVLLSNSIGDKVWFDSDNDGMQDPSEVGVSGIYVNLIDAITGNVIASTRTDASGNYLFTNLPPNTDYKIQFLPVPGTVLTSSTGTTADNNSTNSDADPVTKLTANVNTGAAGTQITGIDAGIKNDPLASIGDFVWNDLDADGVVDPGEPGIPGVTMNLYSSTGTLLATTVTDINGNYVFSGLPAGDYRVGAVLTNPNYVASSKDQGTNDLLDSDFDATSVGTLAPGSTVVSNLITLPNSGTQLRQDMSIDLGIHSNLPASNRNTLGNLVWFDRDNDGVQDGTTTEPGAVNVTVSLFDATGTNPVNNPATGAPYVVRTGNSGTYNFVDLPDGTYTVKFSNLPDGYSITVKDAASQTPQSPLNQNETDSDGDASPATGITDAINLDASSASATPINIVNIDAGINNNISNRKGSLGDKVWWDLDADGIQDPGETGVDQLQVTLLKLNTTTNVYDSVGVRYTDATGGYNFGGLDAGTYVVRFYTDFPANNGITTSNAGANDAIDSDGNTVGVIGVPLGTNVNTSPYNSNSSYTNPLVLGQGVDNLTVDLGILKIPNTNTLGDKVWWDNGQGGGTSADGVQNGTEVGVPGVELVLLTSAGAVYDRDPAASGIQPYVTTTDKDGNYLFVNLPDGDYKVLFKSYPAGFTLTTANAVGTEATDSDADQVSGVTSQTYTLNAGNRDERNVDGGLVTGRAALGNKVWNDIDGDGVQDAGESGVIGVTVTLYASDGVTAIASTVTDADGEYYFPNLTPGSYIVGFTDIPTGQTFTQQVSAGDNGNDTNSDVSPATGKTALITLVAGENDITIDAGITSVLPARIGDLVWLDINNDGIQDPTEPGVPGVIVTLYNSSNQVVGTGITDGRGSYTIGNIPPGTDYYVVFSNTPDGLAFTKQNDPASTTNTTYSDANPLTGRSPSFNLTTGQNYSSLDAGLVLPAGLGNRVWLDNDKDGIQDSGEPGVSGVGVTLFQNGTDGMPGTADDVLVMSTVTDAYGNYFFDKLTPTTTASTLYNVQFTPPANYTFTPQTNTQSTAGTNPVISSTNITSGSTITNGSDAGVSGSSYGRTGSFSLTAGQRDSTVDAGLIIETPTPTVLSSIGDKVFFDQNNNNTQDATDQGIAGVTVELLKETAPGSGVYVPYRSTVTDGNGKYIFNDLPNANYKVKVSKPAGTDFITSGGTTPANNTDSDVSITTGETAPISIAAPGTVITGIDAGLKKSDDTKAQLGDRVWLDVNKDGIQDVGEPGISGVTVELYLVNGLGQPTGGPVATTTTDVNGNYLFSNLTPTDTSASIISSNGGYPSNAYFVKFVSSSPALAGLTPTVLESNNMDAFDSDLDLDLSGFISDSVLLSPGEKNLSSDAGYIMSPSVGALGDRVWNDLDANGIQDAGEPGVPGVTVVLYDNAGNPVDSTSTDASGSYLFYNLTPGNYSVGFKQLPPNFVFTKDNIGTNDNADSDANPATGRTATVAVVADEITRSLDAGINNLVPTGKASLGNRVWYDLNNNGIQDAGETGVSGIVVNLYKDANNDGTISGAELTPLATQITNGLGEYMFGGLDAGTYQVGFDKVPSGYTLSALNASGGLPSNNSDGNPLNTAVAGNTADADASFSNLIPLAIGEKNLDIDLGIVPPVNTNTVGNKVWIDQNSDGIQDASEPGIAGVVITLIDPATGNTLATTTSDANGNYAFVGLPDGDYQVRFANLPSGLTPTTRSTSNDATGSDADPLSGFTFPVTVNATNRNDISLDLGMKTTKAGLGNYVWIDSNKDGVQDASENPAAGVTVSLFRPGFGVDGIAGNADDALPVASMITGEDGKYQFINLDPGNYEVEFTTIPTGMEFTSSVAGGDNQNNTNSDANPANTNGRTASINLVAGEFDQTIDAGITPIKPAQLGSRVWIDENNDGLQDANEPGLSGVKVTLLNALNEPVATTFTDGNGNWSLTNVAPGTGYKIEFDANLPTSLFSGLNPVNYATGNVGSSGSLTSGTESDLDSDVDPNGTPIATTVSFNVAAGDNFQNIDAGIVQLSNQYTLPVRFIEFTANKVGETSSLKFTIAQAAPNSRFDIERSISGNNFVTIGNLVGTSATTYNFTDVVPFSNAKNYYRIKEIDAAGQVTYSVIRMVKFTKDGKIDIYPIPANTTVNVSFNGQQVGKSMIINIVDQHGKLITSERYNRVSATESIDVSKLPNGIYHVNIYSNSEKIATQKIVVIH